MLLGALIFAIVWCLIALFLRRYPETMAGYNTMPKREREKIDIDKVARLLTRSMYAGVPFAMLSPLMPSEELYMLMLVVVVQNSRFFQTENKLFPNHLKTEPCAC